MCVSMSLGFVYVSACLIRGCVCVSHQGGKICDIFFLLYLNSMYLLQLSSHRGKLFTLQVIGRHCRLRSSYFRAMQKDR